MQFLFDFLVGLLGGRPQKNIHLPPIFRGNCEWNCGPIMLNTPLNDLNAKLELKNEFRHFWYSMYIHIQIHLNSVHTVLLDMIWIWSVCAPYTYPDHIQVIPGHYFFSAVEHRQPHGFLEHLQRCQQMCCGSGPILWFNMVRHGLTVIDVYRFSLIFMFGRIFSRNEPHKQFGAS